MLSRHQQSRSSLFSWIAVSDFFLVMTVFLMICLTVVVREIPADTNATQPSLTNLTPTADLSDENARLKKGLAILVEDRDGLKNSLKKMNEEIIRLQGKIDRLSAERDRQKSLQKPLDKKRTLLEDEIDRLKNALKKMQEQNRRSKAKFRESTASLESLRAELLNVREFSEDTQKKLKDRFLKPLYAARLVIKVRTTLPRDLPLDLDLYVQDPNNQLCYWKRLRVITTDGEAAAIIPSEDLSLLPSRGEDPPTEEIYCAATPILKRVQKPYLVFVMLRKIGAVADEKVEQNVSWEVIVKNDELAEVAIKKGKVSVTTTGAVTNSKTKEGWTFSGLVCLLGFDAVYDAGVQIKLRPKEDLPMLPRGWVVRKRSKDSYSLQKLRDR